MDELGLKRYCCRRMIMTHVDLIEKLLKYGQRLAHRAPGLMLTNSLQVYPRRPKRDQAEAQRTGIKIRSLHSKAFMGWRFSVLFSLCETGWRTIRNFYNSQMTEHIYVEINVSVVCQPRTACEPDDATDATDATDARASPQSGDPARVPTRSRLIESENYRSCCGKYRGFVEWLTRGGRRVLVPIQLGVTQQEGVDWAGHASEKCAFAKRGHVDSLTA